VSEDKERFSARVKASTLEILDREAERRDRNRSKTIEKIVEEWEAANQADEEESDRLKTPGTGSEWLLFVAGALAGLLSSILLSSDSEEALVAWVVSGAAYGIGGLPALRWVAVAGGAYIVVGLLVKIARELWRSADTPEVTVDA
jgi:hypothetical protein